jgi:maltose-binding protein MalE
MKRILFGTSLTVLALICLSSCGSSSSNTASVNTGNNASTAQAMAKDYAADSKSSAKYDGKAVEISGKFERSSGSIEEPELKFETGNSVQVTCKVSKSAIQAVAKFEKGQEIKMIGIGDPITIIGPMFKECEVAP